MTESKRKQGRPLYEPTDEQREAVQMMAACGVPQADIARATGPDGIALNTLRKHFARELELGALVANTKVATTLYKQAVGSPAEFDDDGNQTVKERPPNVAAAIFWAKTRMGWRETVEVAGSLSHKHTRGGGDRLGGGRGRRSERAGGGQPVSEPTKH